MTDNEIVKALEHCWIKDEGCGSKEDCPYYGLEKCIQNSVEDGIDLIKRQQKRIDRIVEQLEAKAEDFRKYWDEFGDEDEISIMIGYKRAIEIVKGGGGDEEEN